MENIIDFQREYPQIKFLDPATPGFDERQKTRGAAGDNSSPFGIAVPKDAQQVADIVQWATKSGVELVVRTGGNDFYGRCMADGALVVDMRDINFVYVADDKKTAKVGGGVIGTELLKRFEEEDVIAPMGNLAIIGYVGWATLGGYGPFTNNFGMGYEGIFGAQVVNAKGEIEEADEEILEGIRGMGGNLGIITSLTIKVYPARKMLSGALFCPATKENVVSITSAEKNMDIPKCLVLHHFITKGMVMIMFSWTDPDHDKGQQFLAEYTKSLGPDMTSRVKPNTAAEHYAAVPNHTASTPWGGQRSLYVTAMSSAIVDTLTDAMSQMPPDQAIGWSAVVEANKSPDSPRNTFGAGPHILLSFSDLAVDESAYAEAKKWADDVWSKLQATKDEALTEQAYISLSRPEDRTAKQLLGDKWERARQLKDKYDPDNVFKNALPRMYT